MKPFLAGVALFGCFLAGLIIHGQSRVPPQPGTIAGQVVSSNGTPSAGVRVVAIAARKDPSGAEFVAGLAQTDSAGRYLLEEIPPGRYWIGAGTLQSPVFHPGVPTSSKATVVTVNAGSRITGMDFAIVRTAFNVTGRVVSEDGVSLPGRLILNGGGRQVNAPIAADGTFEFRNLAAGEYQVSLQLQGARGGRGNRTLSGIPNVLEIVDRDIQFELRVPKSAGPNTLQSALEGLEQAASSLRSAAPQNKGGHLELAIVEAEKAVVTMRTAMHFAADHPETKEELPIPSEIRVDFNPATDGGTAPNLRAALIAFREALEALERSPGGNLGGHRAAVYREIAASVAEIQLGLLAVRDYTGGGGGVRGFSGATASNLPAGGTASPLDRALAALSGAAQSLRSTSPGNKGGNVEKAIVEVDRAITDLRAAIQFAAEHPDAAAVAPTAMVKPNFNPPTTAGAPNLRAALNSLSAAFDELTRAPGGDLGGNRGKVHDGIAATVKTIHSAYEVAIQSGCCRGAGLFIQ
jgi:hypothetical protein